MSRLDSPSAVSLAICSSCGGQGGPGVGAAAQGFAGRAELLSGTLRPRQRAQGVEGLGGGPQWRTAVGRAALSAQPATVREREPGPLGRPRAEVEGGPESRRKGAPR
jgi:hypothetical protein